MAIRFSCANCEARVKVPDGAEGRKMRCPRCGHLQRVPMRSEDKPSELKATPSPVDETASEAKAQGEHEPRPEPQPDEEPVAEAPGPAEPADPVDALSALAAASGGDEQEEGYEDEYEDEDDEADGGEEEDYEEEEDDGELERDDEEDEEPVEEPVAEAAAAVGSSAELDTLEEEPEAASPEPEEDEAEDEGLSPEPAPGPGVAPAPEPPRPIKLAGRPRPVPQPLTADPSASGRHEIPDHGSSLANRVPSSEAAPAAAPSPTPAAAVAVAAAASFGQSPRMRGEAITPPAAGHRAGARRPTQVVVNTGLLNLLTWVCRLAALIMLGVGMEAMVFAGRQQQSVFTQLLFLLGGVAGAVVAFTVGEVAAAVKKMAERPRNGD